MRNLDIAALRAFVTLADTGSVTRAAERLNLTQSAVSMQIKRLEESLSQALTAREGRALVLTTAGERALRHAQNMIALNDDMLAIFRDDQPLGEVCLGVPHDIVSGLIPEALRQFSARFPGIKVRLESSHTLRLLERFAEGSCDIILGTENTVAKGGRVLAQVPLLWHGADGGTAHRNAPLRLAFARDCLFRTRAIEALDQAGRPWEIAVEAAGAQAIDAVVSADLAVTALLGGFSSPGFAPVDPRADLPDLGVQAITLYHRDGPSYIAGMVDVLTSVYSNVCTSTTTLPRTSRERSISSARAAF